MGGGIEAPFFETKGRGMSTLAEKGASAPLVLRDKGKGCALPDQGMRNIITVSIVEDRTDALIEVIITFFVTDPVFACAE